MTAKFNGIYTVLWNKYYFDELYDKLFVNPVKGAISQMAGWFDLNIIDGLVNLMGTITRALAFISRLIDEYIVDGIVNGIAAIITASGTNIRRMQTGRLQNYLLIVFGGIVILILLLSALT